MKKLKAYLVILSILFVLLGFLESVISLLGFSCLGTYWLISHLRDNNSNTKSGINLMLYSLIIFIPIIRVAVYFW